MVQRGPVQAEAPPSVGGHQGHGGAPQEEVLALGEVVPLGQAVPDTGLIVPGQVGAVPLVGEQQGHGDDPHEGALAIDVGPREVTPQKLGDVHTEPVENGQQIEAQPIGRAGELVEGHTDLDIVPEAGEDAQAVPVEDEHPLCEHLAAEDTLGEDPKKSASWMETTPLISEQYGHPPYRVVDPGQMSSESISPVNLLISNFPKDTSPELAATVDQESQLAEDGDKASTEDPEGAVDDYMIQDTLVVVEDPCFKREMTSLVQKKSGGMEVIAEAAGFVYEIRFLDTGQVGHDVMMEDHCSQREVVGLVKKESTVMDIIAESSLVSVSEYSSTCSKKNVKVEKVVLMQHETKVDKKKSVTVEKVVLMQHKKKVENTIEVGQLDSLRDDIGNVVTLSSTKPVPHMVEVKGKWKVQMPKDHPRRPMTSLG